MTTTTEPLADLALPSSNSRSRAKRRTFKDVSTEAYNKGWGLGREAARKEFEAAWILLSKHDSDTLLELIHVKEQLRNISLRKLAWSRLTDLFKGGRDAF